jgi:hypothetical protein
LSGWVVLLDVPKSVVHLNDFLVHHGTTVFSASSNVYLEFVESASKFFIVFLELIDLSLTLWNCH